MAYIIKEKKKEYGTAPEGVFQAVCIDVVELGLVTTTFKGEPYTRRMSEIRWLLEEVDEKTGKPFMVLRRFTESLSKKSALRPFLESWRGKAFTSEELDGFDIEKLVGANAQIQIIHNPGSDGTVYANVKGAMPIHKNAGKIAVPQDYIRVKDREGNGNGHQEIDDEDIPF